MDTLYRKMNLENRIDKLSEINLGVEKNIEFIEKNKENVFKLYKVFNGVFIMYSDVNMEESSGIFKYDSDLLLINHCKDGKVEYKRTGGRSNFLNAGEVKVGVKKSLDEELTFPLGRYEGITIIFETNVIDEELSGIVKGFSNRVKNLKEKYCKKSDYYKLSDDESIEYFFSRMYEVPSKIQDEYFKIKVIEIFLYLEAYYINDKNKKEEFISRNQVEKMKLIHDFLIKNISKVYTIEELSEMFNISSTKLKHCFKVVYGEPIFSYMKSYRINHAAQILRTNKMIKIIDVAGMVGYDSPSKFSVAFKKKKGLSPKDYRKKFVKIKVEK